MTSTSPLHRMLDADSIAFVGASNDPTTMGTVQLVNLFRDGYAGRIYPVHPREKKVLGLKAFPALRDKQERRASVENPGDPV